MMVTALSVLQASAQGLVLYTFLNIGGFVP